MATKHEEDLKQGIHDSTVYFRVMIITHFDVKI